MNRSFGPWSTAIGTGVRPELNTFWKRRMAMLPLVGQTASRASRRTVLFVGVLAAVGLAIPTLKWAGHGPLGTLAAQGTGDIGDSAGPGKAAAIAAGGDQAARGGAKSSSRDGVPEYLPRPTKEEETVLETLGQRIDVDFIDLPLEECIIRLGDQTELPFWLDRATLANEGVALDQPIRLKLKATRVESVLHLLLTPIQLEFLFENDVVVITTSSKAAEKLITRTYPVADLIPAPEKPEGEETTAKKEGSDARPALSRRAMPYRSLMQAIENTVAPDSWEALSGPGVMSAVPQTRSLVIRQTWRIHREILQLLRDLRESKRTGPPAPAGTNAAGGK
ncbi:MAG: hypothetical protein ACM3U2_04310 [Deltaproteobacteria bacterium]